MSQVKYFNVHNMSDGSRGLLVNKVLFEDTIIVCNEEKHDKICYIIPSGLVNLDDVTNSTNVIVKNNNAICLDNTDFGALYKFASMAYTFCEMNLCKENITNKKEWESTLSLSKKYMEKLLTLINGDDSNG